MAAAATIAVTSTAGSAGDRRTATADPASSRVDQRRHVQRGLPVPSADVVVQQLLQVVHHGRFPSPITASSSRDALSNMDRSDASAREVWLFTVPSLQRSTDGRLPDVEVLEVAQHDARPLPVRQPGERRHQRRPVRDAAPRRPRRSVARSSSSVGRSVLERFRLASRNALTTALRA